MRWVRSLRKTCNKNKAPSSAARRPQYEHACAPGARVLREVGPLERIELGLIQRFGGRQEFVVERSCGIAISFDETAIALFPQITRLLGQRGVRPDAKLNALDRLSLGTARCNVASLRDESGGSLGAARLISLHGVRALPGRLQQLPGDACVHVRESGFNLLRRDDARLRTLADALQCPAMDAGARDQSEQQQRVKSPDRNKAHSKDA